MSDQDITENYYAGYGMVELNLGKYLMLMPGVRYEKTEAEMAGLTVYQITQPPNVLEDIGGSPNSADREDSFILPMVHARVKPTDFLYFHLAYTQTLSRPDYNAISPNSYYNTGFQPFSYTTGNPQLKPEFWTNYDVQGTLHNPKIGLLAVSGFYKSVEDKIWSRTYKRIKGDPIIEPFLDNHTVNVTAWENHMYDVTLMGVELEWQTSFWYLPKPFNYFTLYLNYTYTKSETQYPTTRIENIVPPEGGRPVATRIDSITSGPMLFQPAHIANASLGFAYEGFNAWFSFQYNGEIYTSKNYYTDVKDDLKEHFYRFDLQLTYDIPVKFRGDLQVLMNVANLSNYMEVRKKRFDPRPTYQEAYGWTIDLGVRYRL
jgi:TonB-dependent receptor